MAAKQAKISKEYIKLQEHFRLRPIKNKAQHTAAVQMVRDLIRIETKLNAEESDYLEVLISLVESYEKTILQPSRPVLPQDILKSFMQEHGLRQVDLLPYVKHKTHLSAFLKGKRNLSKSAAAKLGARFKVDPMLFLPRVLPRA